VGKGNLSRGLAMPPLQRCGLRPSVLGQYRSQTKKIGLGLLVLSYETRSCHACRHNDVEETTTFQVLFIVSLLCAWNVTTLEIITLHYRFFKVA